MWHRPSAATMVACLAWFTAAGCRPSGDGSTAGSDTAPGQALSAPDTDSVGGDSLAGTAWRLVKFEGGDGTVLTPDDGSKYTLAFRADGRLSARIDCNRGVGTWTSTGAPHLELGALGLTRAMCPEGSLHDQMAQQLPYVRSYIMRDGHLFLSLMADGGIYEFERTAP